MVQILPQATSLGNELGQSIGGGLSQGLQTGINQGRLSDAFNKLKGMQGANFQDQLAAIAPALLTTPGGAQALEALSPLIAAQGQQQAIRKSIEERRAKQGGLGASLGDQQIPAQDQGQLQNGAQGQEIYREGKVPSSAETPFPQRTAGPQPQPELSPRQLEDYALDLMENSLLTGKPIAYQQALSEAQNYNNQVRASNQQILKEKQTIDEAQKALTSGMVTRAKNGGYIKTPEDQTVVEKLALQAKNAPNEAEGWEYVRSKMRAFDSAKAALQREVGLSNPLTSGYRKLFGTYKDQNQIIKDIQTPLKTFRDLGLYDEARKHLTEDLGLGNEQAHRAIFPMSKEAKAEISRFPEHEKPKHPSTRYTTVRQEFPGSENSLPEEKFTNFKDELAGFLKKHPKSDLVTLRADLNQGKRYAWEDIYRAIDELVDEKRFSPDLEQDKQLSTIRQQPTPGLGSYFQYLWTGKK